MIGDDPGTWARFTKLPHMSRRKKAKAKLLTQCWNPTFVKKKLKTSFSNRLFSQLGRELIEPLKSKLKSF